MGWTSRWELVCRQHSRRRTAEICLTFLPTIRLATGAKGVKFWKTLFSFQLRIQNLCCWVHLGLTSESFHDALVAKLHEDTMTHTPGASSDDVPENWLEADFQKAAPQWAGPRDGSLFVVIIRTSEPRRFASPFFLQFARPLVQGVLNFRIPSSISNYVYKTLLLGPSWINFGLIS